MDLRFAVKRHSHRWGADIGAAATEVFAMSGASVIVADLDRANAERVAEAISAKGGEAHALTVDVAKAKEVEAMVRFAIDTSGAPHGIVNNAGIGGPSAPTGSYDIEAW